MRTSNFLFDGLFALGTLTGVVLYPAGVGLFGVEQFVPSLYILTRNGIMWLLLAAIAVELTTGAGDGIEFHHIRFDTEVGALLVGAIANVLVLYRIAYTCLLAVQL